MTTPQTPHFFVGLAGNLREQLAICHECLALFTVENRRLRAPEPWDPMEFHDLRKRLLPRLDSVLIKLRGDRENWQKCPSTERERCAEIKNLFQEIQNLLPRILMLDRENQQEMLRRGAMPATFLPPAASQQPNFVASLYRRNTSL